MIFGKHVNKFYKRYWYMILIGIIALVVVDFFQLEIPVIIGNIVNGLERYIDDTIDIAPLTKEVLRSSLLMILGIAGIIFVGRFTWRVTIFNLGNKGLVNGFIDGCYDPKKPTSDQLLPLL